MAEAKVPRRMATTNDEIARYIRRNDGAVEQAPEARMRLRRERDHDKHRVRDRYVATFEPGTVSWALRAVVKARILGCPVAPRRMVAKICRSGRPWSQRATTS
jgi:hypothetical protein